MIKSSIVEGSFENGKSSNVLYAFSPSGYSIGSNINVEPTQRVYLPITERNSISRIRMQLVDQQSRPVATKDNYDSQLAHTHSKNHTTNHTKNHTKNHTSFRNCIYIQSILFSNNF